MTLPVGKLPSGRLAIDGGEIEYRSLSRAEAIRLNDYRGRPDDAELFILTCGTGASEDEAKAFRDSYTLEAAGVLIDAILEVSGLAKSGHPKEPKGP